MTRHENLIYHLLNIRLDTYFTFLGKKLSQIPLPYSPFVKYIITGDEKLVAYNNVKHATSSEIGMDESLKATPEDLKMQ